MDFSNHSQAHSFIYIQFYSICPPLSLSLSFSLSFSFEWFMDTFRSPKSHIRSIHHFIYLDDLTPKHTRFLWETHTAYVYTSVWQYLWDQYRCGKSKMKTENHIKIKLNNIPINTVSVWVFVFMNKHRSILNTTCEHEQLFLNFYIILSYTFDFRTTKIHLYFVVK